MAEAHHIFDRPVHVARRARAKGEALQLLMARVAEDLSDRLAVINHSFAAAVLLGDALGACENALKASGKCLKINSLQQSADDALRVAPASVDAVFSILDLQTINDVPGHLAQAARALRPDGLALFVFFGGESCRELREAWLAAESELTGGASPRVAPMIDLRETGSLLQRAGLALPVADSDRLTLRYGSALSLMQDIHATGFSNCLEGRSRNFVSRRFIGRVAEIYHQRFADADGKVRATLDLCWALAWKPHPSQPKPLKPGSGKVSLADVLAPGKGRPGA
ncbi:MAG: methyltransferase domain-containing protein [Hyphomicrobiales bacterium]